MLDRLKPLAFPFLAILPAALGIIACAIAVTVFASQVSGATSPPGSAEYRNDQFQFSLTYPADMTVTETSNGRGSQSISFLPRSGAGSQFIITADPYSQVDIAAGDYLPHDAYGTEDQGLQLRDVNLIAGGDTSQILFVKDDIMYDIVTMTGDEAWLADILKTWQFD